MFVCSKRIIKERFYFGRRCRDTSRSTRRTSIITGYGWSTSATTTSTSTFTHEKTDRSKTDENDLHRAEAEESMHVCVFSLRLTHSICLYVGIPFLSLSLSSAVENALIHTQTDTVHAVSLDLKERTDSISICVELYRRRQSDKNDHLTSSLCKTMHE